MYNVFSAISDNNIFHIFAFSIIRDYNSKCSNAFILMTNIDKNYNVQKWRYFVMNKLYKCCKYTNTNINKKYESHPDMNWRKFIKYNKSSHIQEIYTKINSNNKSNGIYILLNIRQHNRILWDNISGIKLEYFLEQNLHQLKAPFKYCDFDRMTPEEQYIICSNAKIFVSAHGAGCTNIIFTPNSTPLIEVNFRKHWYCGSNVCDDHFHGNLSINEKCDGSLTNIPYFYKAHYHNLCYLIDKKYVEIQAERYDGGFTSRDPISKKNIYIDGQNLINIINTLLVNY
jgi:hypothetical protein